MLTRKHFNAIAKILNKYNNPPEWLIDEFCYYFEDQNKDFNETKFREEVYK